MARHDTRLHITIEDHDVEVAVEYDFVRGAPATGPTYACGGEPGYGDEFDVRDIKIITERTEEPAPAWLHVLLANDDNFIERIAEAHHAN